MKRKFSLETLAIEIFVSVIKFASPVELKRFYNLYLVTTCSIYFHATSLGVKSQISKYVVWVITIKNR